MSPRRLLPLLLAATLLTAPAMAQESRSAPLKGTLGTEKGVRVLRLRGTPHEMGYAHGFLLGAEIIEGFESYVVYSPVVGGPKNYLGRIVTMVRREMTFLPHQEAELEGMLAGIRAALGERARVPALDRPIELIDLKALNTYGDWYSFACSSFSAWGRLTPDGETITARNFDFPPAPVLETSQLVIAYAPADPARRRWVNVAFPGVTGLISGMSEEGVGIFVHDVRRRSASENETGIHARLLVLREAIETLGPADAPRKALAVLRAHTTAMGNNVHVTSPWDRKTPPAGVIEYDGVESQNDGADLRPLVADACDVFCTNHYRARTAPSRCRRYEKLTDLLGEAASRGTKIDAVKARSMMSAIVQNMLYSRTLHTVIFFPAAKRLELMFSKGEKVAPASEPVGFTVAELVPPRE